MSATLPPLPKHPEPDWFLSWSARELEAIRAYGEQCAAAARLAEREAIASEMRRHAHVLSPIGGQSKRHEETADTLRLVASAIEERKG